MEKIFTLILLLITLCVFTTGALADNIVETKSGLKYKDLVIGDGMKATPQKIATIQLIIWMNDNGEKGKQLYTTYRNDASPLSFKLGTKKIADGLNIGVNGMRVGGKRILYVPPHLNPESNSSEFPGKANLIYEVELVEVK